MSPPGVRGARVRARPGKDAAARRCWHLGLNSAAGWAGLAVLYIQSLHRHRWEASVVRRAGAQHAGSTSLAGEGRALPVNKGCALEEGAQCEEWWEQL